MGIGAPEERPVIRLFFELSVRVEQDGELANHPTESRNLLSFPAWDRVPLFEEARR